MSAGVLRRVLSGRAARWLFGFVIVAAVWSHDGRGGAAPCVMVHPDAEADFSPEWTAGARFERGGDVGVWRNAQGFIGVAVFEDSIVWSSERCALFGAVYTKW